MISGLGSNYENANCAKQAQATPDNMATREYTVTDEKEKSYYMYQEQAQKAAQALTFFRKNPAFDEFIRLVRSGAIQF